MAAAALGDDAMSNGDFRDWRKADFRTGLLPPELLATADLFRRAGSDFLGLFLWSETN